MTSVETPVTSIKDPRVIFARSLKSASGRKQNGACLLYGLQALQWAIQAGWKIQTIFYSREFQHEIYNLPCNCELCPVSEGILKKISDTSYLVPVLSVAAVSTDLKPINKTTDLILMLDGVKDHGNIGTIIRTACAFGINHISLTEMESDLFQRKTIDASRGAVFNVAYMQFQKCEQAITYWKQLGYQIIVTTPYGSGLQSELKLENKPAVLVIGNETEGVHPAVIQQADASIQIPMQPEMESLNVGVAAGISLYEIKIKAVLAMLKQKIQTTLGREIHVAGQLIMKKLEQEFHPVSRYSAYEAVFLMQLSCDREMTREQICQDTGRSGLDLDRLLNHLYRNDFIQPSQDKNECWKITNAAEKWLAEIWPLVESSEKKALKGFSKEEIIQLGSFLKRIQENCYPTYNEPYE